MGYKIEDIEPVIFYAAAAISDNDERLQVAMFSECMVAFEYGVGELHVLDLDGKHTAFCFVLDKFGNEHGARHIHLLSVFKNARRKGAGRTLIEHVMRDINGEPVTLESQPESRQFFEKVGFVAKPEPLKFGLVAMYANGDGSCDQFCQINDDVGVMDSYRARFYNVARSLGLG